MIYQYVIFLQVHAISLLSRRIEEFFYNKYVDIKFNAHGAFLE
jgi:hypothetical protein